MTSHFFRREVLQRYGDRTHGPILLTQPVSFSVLTVLFAGVSAAIVVFFCTFSVSAKATLPGVLLPVAGLIRIVPQGGLVSDSLVREGQSVQAGDALFVLRSERANATGGVAESSISALLRSRRDSLQMEITHQRLQAEQRISAHLRRIEDLGAEQRRIADQLGLQQRRVGFAVEAAERFRQLKDADFASDAAVQEKQSDLLDQRQRLADLERSAATIRRDIADSQAQLQDQKIQQRRDQEATQRNVAALDQELTENEARRALVVRAPQGGTVSAILVERGQTAVSGQPLATLVPTGSTLEATLYAPSRSAGFLRTGLPVHIRYQAYPYQKFGKFHARVLDVSLSAVASSEVASLVLPLVATNEPLYRVRVALDQQSVLAYGITHPLKPGMMLEASVQLEHRRLYEWVLEPAFSIAGRF